MFSYWEKSALLSNIDVAIIGSGVVGMSAAYTLKSKNPKLNVAIFERGFLPEGATTKNAGFACFGSPSELLDDLEKHSEEEVLSIVEKRWKGLERLRKNLGDKAIDFHNWGGYEVFDSNPSFKRCNEQLGYLNKLLSPIIGKKIIYKNTDSSISDFGFKR